jgi:outer membrane protein TolC
VTAVRRAQLDVITKVRTSYLRLLNSYALLDLNERNMTSLLQIAQVARSRYETGAESATDVLLAETEASKLQETRRDLERMISDEKSQLNILVNRDAFTPLDSPQKEILRRMDLPLPQLRARMLAQRPEVRAVVDAVRRDAMASAVPGEEGHPPAPEIADHHVVAGVTERRGDADALGVGEELVEP